MSPHERCVARVMDRGGWHAYQCSKRATKEVADVKVCGTHANVLDRRRFLDVMAGSGTNWRTVRLAHKSTAETEDR